MHFDNCINLVAIAPKMYSNSEKKRIRSFFENVLTMEQKVFHTRPFTSLVFSVRKNDNSRVQLILLFQSRFIDLGKTNKNKKGKRKMKKRKKTGINHFISPAFSLFRPSFQQALRAAYFPFRLSIRVRFSPLFQSAFSFPSLERT